MQSFLSPAGISTPSPQPPLAALATTTGAPNDSRASVGHLLSRAYGLPCSTAALAFSQLVQPTARFQLALDALLPLLDSNASAELAQRILVSFILYSLYAPHPIAVNPFKSALFVAFIKEREKAVSVASEGGVSPNEQLVWVLWKILKGDGNDIGPYSPSTLARSPLPPKLRASNLVLEDELYNSISDLDDTTYLYFQKQNSIRTSASSDNANDNTKYNTPANSTDNLSRTRTPLRSEEDSENERLFQAMRLLLAARDRVLNLQEQRAVIPYLSDIASSRMITSLDLTPIASSNPSIAHPLLVALLKGASPSNDHLARFLDVLPFLPPTLPTFDLLGRLLRDQTRLAHIPDYSTVADLVRMEVLGRFIHEGVAWLERAERDEREGRVADDRFAKGVQNFCRFYHSLIKLGIVDPASDADSAEMAHFTLRNARFEEANMLYRVIAMGRF